MDAQMRESARSTVVIGAGIVGVTTAMQLQSEGHSVILIDPEDPISGCSSGNAGYFSQANVFPASSTESLKSILRILRDPEGPLVIRPAYLPRFLPWGIKAALCMRPTKKQSSIDALTDLIQQATPRFERLLALSGSQGMLRNQGSVLVFRSNEVKALRSARIPDWRERDVEVQTLSAGDVAALEPDVSGDIVGGLYFSQSAHCVNPYRLGRIFFEHVRENGGRYIKDRVIDLQPSEGARWRVKLTDRVLDVPRVVVCAGCWSKQFYKVLGASAPLEAERGYHLMLPTPGVSLSRPISIAEGQFVATPMEHGVRLAGTAEFAGIEAPMNPKRSFMMLGMAKKVIPKLNGEGAVPWMGRRPSLPDGLPAIGRAKAPNLFYNFGHNYNGLMLSAISAKIVSHLVGGSADPLLSRYALTRFN